MTRFVWVFPAAVAITLAGLSLGPPVARAGWYDDITVVVFLERSCLDGTGPADARHVVTLRGPDDRFRDRVVVDSDKQGTWEGCFADGTRTNGGDRLVIRAADDVRRIRLPRLTLFGDRGTDRVWGTAQPRAELFVIAAHQESYCCAFFTSREITADHEGRFMTDFSDELDLIGADPISVGRFSAAGDLFFLARDMPYMQITRNGDVVRGAANPGRPVFLWLDDRDGTTRAEAFADPLYGRYAAQWTDRSGQSVYPETGDRVVASFAVDARVRIPRMWVRGDASSDRVWGRCMPNSPYLIVLANERLGRQGEGYRDGVTSADGSFGHRFADETNLARDTSVTAYCRFPSGDEVTRRARVEP